jgi:hypothetical protein
MKHCLIIAGERDYQLFPWFTDVLVCSRAFMSAQIHNQPHLATTGYESTPSNAFSFLI